MKHETVHVRLFARFRDLAGTDTIALPVPQPPTVASIRQTIERLYPALAGLLSRSAFAVNGEFAAADMAVSPADELALIPPVSGG